MIGGSSAKTTADLFIYQVYPGALDADAYSASMGAESAVLPRQWLAHVIHSAAGSWTYSLGYSYVL